MADERPRFHPIDSDLLPKHFDAPEAEARWDRFWEEQR